MAETVHLLGPGVLRVCNRMPRWEPLHGSPLSIHPEKLKTLLLYGACDVTGAALRILWKHNVQVSFVSPDQRELLGRLSPPADRFPALCYWQHLAASDAGFALRQARSLVDEKVESILDVLRHFQSHRRIDPTVVRQQLQADLKRIRKASRISTLLGCEGAATARWYETLRKLLPAGFSFPRRQIRPPRDPVNALLSLGYTLLASRLETALSAHGLDPLIGVYHQLRPGRPSLVCDLMEPFRIPLVDQLVLGQLRQGFFRPEHFESSQDGTRLHSRHFRRFLQAFEERYSSIPRKCPFAQQIHLRIERFIHDVRKWAETHQAATE